MIRLLVCVLALFPTLTFAQVTIDCRIPDVASTFERLREENQSFIVVQGSPEFDTAQRSAETEYEFEFSGRFTGTALGIFGFNRPFDAAVTYRFTCASFTGETMCGSLRPGVEILAFLERTDQGLTLVQPLCGDTVFRRYLDDHAKMARKCFLGIGCRSDYF